MDHEKHAKVDAFEMEEQVYSNNVESLNGHLIKNKSEEKQVCIYEWTVQIIFV